ncbi:MAG: site-2 protease family protein, partial [Rikenellaceae bacterium]|nr:site-2 protease family protein [Rikenellaceae bacterium]
MWIKIAQLLLSLSLLVIVHELGHFMFAKRFGCRVERFYLFFNPWFSLFKFKKGETEYGIGWIPFGGYVTISGMIDESMNTTQLKEPPKPWEFRTKPAWQRLLVMAGGVMMNLVLAAVIYIGISYVWGNAYVATKDAKYGFTVSPLAREMGFRNGDKILNVDGQVVEDSKDITLQMILDQAGYVEVERAGRTVRIPLTADFIPRILNEKDFLTLRLPVVVANLKEGSPAQAAGLAVGDTVLSVAGRETASVEQLPVV